MNFHEVRLPVRLSFGSTGGVERRTEVVTLASGYERRNSPWAQGRRRYLIGAGLRSLDDMAELTAFFEARRGRLYGFRFRDFADFKSCAPGAAIEPTDQLLGAGDGAAAAFDLVKRTDDLARQITKPVAGSVRIAIDGVEIAGGWSVDTTTGRVSFDTPPDVGAEVTAGFAFDTPVRFDTDRVEVTLETFGAGRVAALPLIEIRT